MRCPTCGTAMRVVSCTDKSCAYVVDSVRAEMRRKVARNEKDGDERAFNL